MEGIGQGVPPLDIVNFADRLAAVALTRDVDKLGYRHRLECGKRWLSRSPSAKTSAKVVLLGSPEGTSGADIVSRLGASPWICILNRRSNAVAQTMMRAATEFVQAPWSTDELAVRLERFTAGLVRNAARLNEEVTGTGIVGNAPNFRAALLTAEKVAASSAPVVIEGETGTGKELIARLIHRLSPAKRAFVAVNCGCLPPELVENELFGHEAGAFTGATTARTGLVQQADGGTLFLDEVDTLTHRAQVALLRFLEQGEVRAIGGGKLRQVNVRVLAAANRPLADLVANNSFREDLYFRLNTLGLTLPPLRERPGDIVELAQHFTKTFGVTYGHDAIRLSDEAVSWLTRHDLPGNVRQLQNLIHRAVVSAECAVIRLSDIAPPGTPPELAMQAAIEPYAKAKERAVSAFERRYLTGLMNETGGNVTAAAEQAGKERRAFGKLLKKHRIGPYWNS